MTSSRRERKVMSALSKIVVFKRFGLWRQEFISDNSLKYDCVFLRIAGICTVVVVVDFAVIYQPASGKVLASFYSCLIINMIIDPVLHNFYFQGQVICCVVVKL